MQDQHRFLLRELLSLLTAQEGGIKHVELEIERHVYPYEEQMSRCEQIIGVSRHVLHVLIVEIGMDMSRFPDADEYYASFYSSTSEQKYSKS